MTSEDHAATWFQALSPPPERLKELESRIQARLSEQPAELEVPSLSAEWGALLRERPVANTLLVAAAAAVLAVSIPFGALAAAAKLFV